MLWKRGERSANLEDRRDESGPLGGGIGGGGLRIGLGGAVALLLLSLATGQNFFAYLEQIGIPVGGAPEYAPSASREGSGTTAGSPEEEKLVDFVSFVLDDVQKTWAKELPKTGTEYQDAKLVLFRDSVQSGCGYAEGAMGPFYCPADAKVYVDLGFYDELKRRFGAPGDFAQAYVLAHEIGHHLQNILGIERKVRQLQQMHPQDGGELSIRLELQADCFAGVWGNTTAQRNILERDDVEEGLAAAAAVGDDRIQKQTTGYVNPERWTHGSAQQRVTWFKKGLMSGRLQDCNTFE